MRAILRLSPLLPLALVLAAAPGRADEPVTIPSVERANLHQLVFFNDDLMILRNAYPPQSDSGYHRHELDLFAVIIEPARTSVQVLGKPIGSPSLVAAGTTSYGSIAQPIVHRVVNVDSKPFLAIVVEIRRAQPHGTAADPRDAAYVPVLDNARLRAWRLILPPGASAPAIHQADMGVRIVVRGGMLMTGRDGQPDQTLALRAGDVALQPAAETRTLSNRGTDTIELVELELK